MKEYQEASVRRRAFILVAVLGLAVLVAVLGLTFLDTHSTVMPEAVNRSQGLRALLVAESGIATAMRFLMYPPLEDGNPMPQDEFYSGANGLAVDDGPDFADVEVVRPDDATPNLYRITSKGVAHSYDGTVGARRTITTEIIVSETDKWEIPFALLDRNALNVLSGVNVTGHIHANGGVDLYLGSSRTGNVSSTATVRRELALGIFVPSCLELNVICNVDPPFTCPAGTTNKYENYVINGRIYTAHTYDNSTLFKSDADALNAILNDQEAANPGRIVVYKGGNLRLRASDGPVVLNGTLVITSGNLEFHDGGYYYEINAVENYPALVLAQGIRMTNSNDTLVTINGSVLCEGEVNLGDKRRSTLIINGSLIKTGEFAGIRSGSDGGRIDINSTGVRKFWDLESVTPPVTVLSWKGN